MKSSELNQRRQQATPRGVGVMCNYFVEKAENATLWDVEGNEVIDFAAGIAVLNTGHRHPKIVAAVAQHHVVMDLDFRKYLFPENRFMLSVIFCTTCSSITASGCIIFIIRKRKPIL